MTQSVECDKWPKIDMWKKKIKSDEKWWVKKIYKRQKVTREINHKWQKVTIGTKKNYKCQKSTSD